MSAIADRSRRVAAGFTARVDAVPEDAWGSPSPCEGWTARDVVAHLIEASGIFLGFIDRKVPDTPSVEQNPGGAWAAARDAVQEALDDPAVATTGFEGFFGPTTFEQAVDRFLTGDVLMHTWDLARATGLDERLDPDEVHVAFEELRALGDSVRSPGVFGPEVDPPPGADEQARLLAFSGRRV